MRDFIDLKVWQKAHQWVLEIYRVSKTFPSEERYGLTNQLRRSASSVSANIAEGCDRKSEKEFASFLNIAAGSASEAEYQTMLASDLGYINKAVYEQLKGEAEEIKKCLTPFYKNWILQNKKNS